jgi:hyperosmotically inducible periplasmic protein
MKSLNSIKIGILLITLLFYSQIFAQTATTGNMGGTAPGTAATAIDDPTITSNVLTKISQDNTLTGSSITASSQQGVVTLNGTVSSQAQADAAMNAAKSVNGVKNVQSNITVK